MDFPLHLEGGWVVRYAPLHQGIVGIVEICQLGTGLLSQDSGKREQVLKVKENYIKNLIRKRERSRFTMVDEKMF